MNVIEGDFKQVPTRALLALQKQQKEIEYKSLAFKTKSEALKPHKPIKNDSKSKEEDKEDENMFDIKKARREVINFAAFNQRTLKSQERMQILQAIKLGAKPPKKAYKNYKELKEERKRLKEVRQKRREFHQLGKTQTGAPTVKCNVKKNANKNKKRIPVSGIDKNYGVVKNKKK